MDVSTLFRASVKTVSLQKKLLNEDVKQSKMRKLRRTESAFSKKSQLIVSQVGRLKEFLIENRSAYLNLAGYLKMNNHLGQMSDLERDEIDRRAQEIIATCSQMIQELKRDLVQLDTAQQDFEHREIVLHLIEDYLKSICKIYSEEKAIRIKKTIEIKKLSKLELNLNNRKQTLEVDGQSNNPALIERAHSPSSANSSPLKVQEMNGDVNPVYEEELSAEDIQMFEAENEQLYNELNTITEEVKQIESKVVHIAELQEIFTEKVLTQDRDLDKLMTTVVGSTENVKEANEQIRQAIQRNAGLRVWLLFFLIVISFSLLFLDWYNP